MRVRLLSVYAGPRGVFHPKDFLDVPEAEARALIDGGYAIAVEQAVADPAPEAAVESPEVEAAVEPPADERRVADARPLRRRR